MAALLPLKIDFHAVRYMYQIILVFYFTRHQIRLNDSRVRTWMPKLLIASPEVREVMYLVKVKWYYIWFNDTK